MPVASTVEENYRLLFAIVKCSGNLANIDWDEVSKITGLSKSAVTQHFRKIKKAMEVGEGDSNPQPRATRKKRTNGANGPEPVAKKAKTPATAETMEDEDE